MTPRVGISNDIRAFKRRLRLIMLERDVSQNELAGKLGTTPSTVNAWCRGTSPSVPEGKHMLRLPRVLKCNGHWLLTGEGHMDAEPGTGFRAGVERERERLRRIVKQAGLA